jgi:hypothetical protein
VRLLSLDPLDASELLARLSSDTDAVATAAAQAAASRPRASPPCRRRPRRCWTSPVNSTPPGPSGSSPPETFRTHLEFFVHLDHPVTMP